MFMDSPGNDLESICGQVASGCNIVFFSTGNGSITNFPFVPTVKIVSTSTRFKLLSNDMDVDAGRYCTGTSMDDLGNETFKLTLAVASGMRTVGEKAGHYQTGIWRSWKHTRDGPEEAAGISLPGGNEPKLSDGPLKLNEKSLDESLESSSVEFDGVLMNEGPFKTTTPEVSSEAIVAILPTSLCSSTTASLIAKRLNESMKRHVTGGIVSRFVALPHTEGCGVSEAVLSERVLIGHFLHPSVRMAVFLEHGCEKTHNDHFKAATDAAITDAGGSFNQDEVGWFSCQLDGGIESVTAKVEAWVESKLSKLPPYISITGGLGSMKLALHSRADGAAIDVTLADAMSQMCIRVVAAGGSIVMPSNSGFLESPAFMSAVIGSPDDEDGINPAVPALEAFVASLKYGGSLRGKMPGFHIMEVPRGSKHWVETLSGLGGTGIHCIMVHHSPGKPISQSHPFIPTLQFSTIGPANPKDMDLIFDSTTGAGPIESRLLGKVATVLGGTYVPRGNTLGNTDFQITRGHTGISL